MKDWKGEEEVQEDALLTGLPSSDMSPEAPVCGWGLCKGWGAWREPPWDARPAFQPHAANGGASSDKIQQAAS